MKGMLFARRLGAGVAVAVLGVGLVGGVASAGGQHGGTAHGTELYNQIVVTFVPSSSPVSLPAGCWMSPTDAFMAVTGNAQGHAHPNKNGFWATNTFTGTASVLPIVFKTTGMPEKVTPTTPTSNTVVTTTATPLATGHLTVWDGVSVNRSTVVEHATLTFKGNLATGAPVSMSGLFHFTWTHVVYTTTGNITFTKSTLTSVKTTSLTC